MIGAWFGAAFAAEVVVRGAVVHPVSGPPIEDGAVWIRDGRIVEVGTSAKIGTPAGAVVFTGAVVTPGLIDGLSVVGLTGILNRASDQDHEARQAVVPGLRAADAYDPWEPLVGWLLAHGVTSVATGPSPGAPVGGRTFVTHTLPGPVAEIALATDGMVVFTLGEGSKGLAGAQTRMDAVALVRQALTGAREYAERRRLPLADRAPIDLGQEALVDLLERRRRAVFVAHRSSDLLAAIGLMRDFGLDGVLAGATEGYLVRDQIKAANIDVLVGPMMARAWNDLGERHHGSFENAALLADAGVRIGVMSGYESYVPKVRVVLWEAAIAAANGLGPDRALAALTRDNAAILGIGDRVGTLEVGKVADLVVFDGDPFEYTTHVCQVLVAGRPVYTGCR